MYAEDWSLPSPAKLEGGLAGVAGMAEGDQIGLVVGCATLAEGDVVVNVGGRRAARLTLRLVGELHGADHLPPLGVVHLRARQVALPVVGAAGMFGARGEMPAVGFRTNLWWCVWHWFVCPL